MLTVIEDRFAAPHPWADRDAQVTRWSASPTRDEVRDLIRGLDGGDLVVSGSLASLSTVIEGLRRAALVGSTPVTFLAGATADGATHDFVDLLSLPTNLDEALAAAPTELALARNDIGGVLLHEVSFAPARGRGFGAQAYHDDALIADGLVRRIDVRVDYSSGTELLATVTPPSGRRRTSTSTGRAVQIATEAVGMAVDGRGPDEVDGRTWYVDDREHWLLRGATLPRHASTTPPATRSWWRRR